MNLTKRFFRRAGDGLSARDSHERIALSDGTCMLLNVELTMRPDRVAGWYVSVASKDRAGRHAGDWCVTVSNKSVRRVLALAKAQRNMLLRLSYKQRRDVIKSWFRKTI